MENSPVRTCVEGPLFVSLSFSIGTGLSNRMPPLRWLLAPLVRQDAEQRPPDDRWCYTTATVFVSEWAWGGGLGLTSTDGYDSESASMEGIAVGTADDKSETEKTGKHFQPQLGLKSLHFFLIDGDFWIFSEPLLFWLRQRKRGAENNCWMEVKKKGSQHLFTSGFGRTGEGECTAFSGRSNSSAAAATGIY